MDKIKKLLELLLKLEQELVKADLWQQERPKASALQSTQPFCHDTLTSEQWLQFIFIAKLEQLATLNQPLPNGCQITPYIAEALKEHNNVEDITKITHQIDELLG